MANQTVSAGTYSTGVGHQLLYEEAELADACERNNYAVGGTVAWKLSGDQGFAPPRLRSE